jgi:hypothetical protein
MVVYLDEKIDRPLGMIGGESGVDAVVGVG